VKLALFALLAGCTGPDPEREVDTDPLPAEPVREPCRPEPPLWIGTATHYLVDDAGKCMLGQAGGAKRRPPYNDPGAARSDDQSSGSPSEAQDGRLIAAVSTADYAAGALCGACVLVTGPLGQVLVRITDECPACKRGDLDLGRDAFPLIAPLDAGRVPIAWRIVACPGDGNFAFKFKDGTNASWLGVQVREHRYPLATVEARDPANTAPYKLLVRTDYNYFIGVNLGAGPLALRVTDTFGHVAEEPSIALADPSTLRTGTRQLTSCP
jgi:expansin (peptidoglycan-binding protein)